MEPIIGLYMVKEMKVKQQREAGLLGKLVPVEEGPESRRKRTKSVNDAEADGTQRHSSGKGCKKISHSLKREGRVSQPRARQRITNAPTKKPN